MPRYAQVNTETGIVESDSFLRDEGMEEFCPELIPIEDGFDLFQKKWDFETETWVEYIPEETESVEPEPTQLDRIEETVNNIATNSTSWDAMAQAISEGVNEV